MNMMIPTNPATLFSWKPFLITHPLIPSSINLRCQAAADLTAGAGWLHSSALLDDVSSPSPTPSSSSSSSNKVDKIKMNAQKGKWSRDRESYLVDISEPLPLPMTYPNSSPVPSDEINRRLNCDPLVKFCSRTVKPWSTSGLGSAEVAKALALSATSVKGAKRLSASAFLAKESDMFRR